MVLRDHTCVLRGGEFAILVNVRTRRQQWLVRVYDRNPPPKAIANGVRSESAASTTTATTNDKRMYAPYTCSGRRVVKHGNPRDMVDFVAYKCIAKLCQQVESGANMPGDMERMASAGTAVD